MSKTVARNQHKFAMFTANKQRSVSMMKQVDLVIAGGGFAGLVCAQAAAIRGVRTVVTEKNPVPGFRPHTTGLLVKEAADLLDVPARFVHKIHNIRLYSPALDSLDLHREGYFFLATDTTAVLAWLARAAHQAGAGMRFHTPVRRVCIRQQRVELPEIGLQARYLVGSDGAKSKIARLMGLGVNRHFLVGLEAHFRGIRGLDRDSMHVFIDQALAKGYIAWVLPGVAMAGTGECVTQIGLASRDPRQLSLDRFIHRIRHLFDFDKARETHRRGGCIPCGGLVKPFYRDQVMLLGDAAGMVSPLTAGGIHPALAMGRVAGIAISDHLLDGGLCPGRLTASAATTYPIKKLLRSVADISGNGLLNACFRQPLFRYLAQTVFYHHRGLLAAAAWRDILFANRHPSSTGQ